MKTSIQTKITQDQLAGIIHYVAGAIVDYKPDHDDVDLMLRMVALKQLHLRLQKRQIEVGYQPNLKVTIPAIEALALLAQWKGSLLPPHPHTSFSVMKITDLAHKTWM